MSTMKTGRPRTASDEQVLDAAARVIARAGPSALTLAEVGREVGLSAAAVVQRFGSRRALLLAVARHGTDVMPRQVAVARDADAPVAALVDVLAGIAGGIGGSDEFAHHLAFLLMDLSDPEFRENSRDFAAALEGAIAGVLAAGRAAGELVSGDPEQLARAVHAAYNGALVAWGLAGDGSPADRVREQLTLLLGPHLGTGHTG